MVHRAATRRQAPRRAPALATLAAAVVLVVAGCHSGQDTGGIRPAPVPSDPATSASASPSPSSSPHPSPSATSAKPDPDAVAAKAAVTAYKHYVAAGIRDAKREPTGKPAKDVLALTTGSESTWVRNEAASRKKLKRRIVSGSVRVLSGPVSVSDNDHAALFQVCLDYRKIKSEDDGKPIATVSWVRNRVHMKQVSGRWLVSQQDGWQGKVGDSCPSEIK